MGLGAADACAGESGNVPVAAVLAQHGRGVPQPGDRVAGHREGAPSGVHHPTPRGRARRGLGDQVGGPRQAGGRGQLGADDPPYGGRAASCHAAKEAPGGIVSQALGMCRSTSPSAKL